jgi:hypothetical protein
MNWTAIIIVGILIIALLVFIIAKNKKDKKDLVNKIENDYPKPHEEPGDAEIDKVLK